MCNKCVSRGGAHTRTCQDVLEHAGQGVLSPGAPPGDVPSVELRPHQQEEEPLHLLLRHHLTQVDGGSGGAGDASEHLQRGREGEL